MRILVVGLIVLFTSCSLRNETIKIKGSDTEVNLAAVMAEQFHHENSEVLVSISGGGSGLGIASLLNGNADIANSSRRMKDGEFSIFENNKIEIDSFVFAQDAIAFIMSDKIALDSISTDAIAKILSGEFDNWSSITNLDLPFTIYGRQNNSGTHDYVKNTLKIQFSPYAKQMNGNAQIIEAIKSDNSGIGYVSAWACRQQKVSCVSLSHQCAVLNKKAPKPKNKDFVGKVVLRYYAPCTSSYGFHFECYDKNIFTPVIRSEVRDLKVTNKGHYTVYLPAYSDGRIIALLHQVSHINWQVFSKHARRSYTNGNVFVQPIQNEIFLQSLASCKGVLCGAGFETPAEALFLKKKVAVIPMKTQYEQQCNAAALKSLGVTVIKSLKEKHVEKLLNWVDGNKVVSVHYPDQTEKIIRKIIKNHISKIDLGEEDISMDLTKLLFE